MKPSYEIEGTEGMPRKLQVQNGTPAGLDLKNKNQENYTNGGFEKSDIWEATSLLDTVLLSPHRWLKKKREYDGHGKLWRVLDNLYDLSSYVDSHPGGSDWLSITQGTDITELFMSAHAVNFKMVESVLENFYVGPAEGPRKAPYTFKENDFFMTVKRRAEPILRKYGTGPTLESTLIQDGFGLGAIACGILGAMYSSNLILILSGALLYCSIACAHNFLHLKDTWRKYYYDFSLLPSYDFRIVHCLSHHVFPNTLLDSETISLEPFLKHRHVEAKSFLQRFGVLAYIHVIFFFALNTIFLLKMFRIFVLKEHSFRPENVIVFVEFVVLLAVSPTFIAGALSWILIHGTCSYILLFIGSTVAHHDTSCFHDGDQIRANPDWGMCQLDATRDTPQEWDNLLVTLIIFGEHPVHHLFPTVDHSKCHLLKSLMMKTMGEFGMEYPRLTRYELIMGAIRNAAKLTSNIFSSNVITVAAK